MQTSIGEFLDPLTHEGELYEKLDGNAVRCFACGHRCLIREGKRGICQVRFNQGGELRVPWGYVASIAPDPVEKKPFFHLLPGATALSFGMLGCDFRCPFCQNWEISQTLRDPGSDEWARTRPAPGQERSGSSRRWRSPPARRPPCRRSPGPERSRRYA